MKKANSLRFGLALFLVAIAAQVQATQRTELGEVAFHQALLDAGTGLRLMCVAAHPDDEDGATLARYRRKYGYRTFAVIATRGEGGQNEIGPELYEELGVIRTYEMMAAAEVTGARLHFLNLPEFGYSKTLEETLDRWGEQNTLRRLVRAIRTIRPDVIITNHGASKDHGHHQAIGAMLKKAFDASADPTVFPEQREAGLEPWQAARLYIRSWDKAPDAVTIDIDELDPVLGRTYAEIAAKALERHRSQGMGFFIRRYLTGNPKAYYTLVKDTPEGVSGGRTDVAAPGGVLFDGLQDRCTADDRALSRGTLFRAERTGTSLSGTLGALAAELRLSATLDDDVVVPGQTILVKAELTDFGAREAESVHFGLTSEFGDAPSGPVAADINAEGRAEAVFEVVVPKNQSATLPHSEHLFDEGFLGPQFTVVASVDCGRPMPLVLHVPVRVDVTPPVGIAFVDAPYLMRLGADESVTFRLRLTNHTSGPVEGVISLSPSAGLYIEPEEIPFKFSAEGDEKVVPIVGGLFQGVSPRDYHLGATVRGHDAVTFGTARAMALATPEGIRVGVVQSYNDVFARALDSMNVPHAALELADFVPSRLDTFSAVIIDIRAYLVRPDLVANNQTLLDYVARGGTLLVMYQKTYEWKPEYAPYPIRVSHNRVTDETAPMTVLVPGHPLFNSPNPITPRDWDGWIQERGLYFPDQWDTHYTPLVSCSDPGEDFPPGAVLVAAHGKGTYLYTSLVWYRQLRELHPGALKVFANMLVLGSDAAGSRTTSETPGSDPAP
jgi:LmbE family N-acetylglucosaminyl deacetylase